MINVTVNGVPVRAEEGRTVLEVAAAQQIEIPTLCHHPALEAYGACRLCVVEARQGKWSKIVTSCNYEVWEGLEILTDSERVRKSRKITLELLRASCPDAPELAALAEQYGAAEPRFPAESGKCILCGLCIRVCRERMGVAAADFSGRGVGMKVDTPYSRDSDVCITCGACAYVCPTGAIDLNKMIAKNAPIPLKSEFEAGVGVRPVVGTPNPQAVPNVPVIDKKHCVHMNTGECGICSTACPAGAIDYEQQDRTEELKVGAVIASPGYEVYDALNKSEYGFGRYPNVVNSLQFERILSASGPYKGHVVRPSDHKEPKKVAFLQCVGSRDAACGNDYCSSVCCMYAVKEAVIAREHDKNIEPTIFFMDVRSFGKDFDKYIDRAENEHGVRFVRSRVARVNEAVAGNDLELKFESEDGKLNTERFDMVVLSVGLCSPGGAEQLAAKLGIDINKNGFVESPAFNPLATTREGIFVGGAFAGPKDIPETVMEASAAASAAGELLAEARNTEIVPLTLPDEKDIRDQGPRIGVFVCQCGINIGGVVDVPDVAAYAATLPDVVYSTDNLYTCSKDAQELIKEKIVEHDLNRVVVASCTPRTHEPLFQETIREAGLNEYMFEMANIRDQDSWVHREHPAEATAKAKDLTRMAVAKARFLDPLEKHKIDVNHEALVIGGGLAGLTAAKSLAQQGFQVHLVERTGELGGNARHIHYDLAGSDVSAFLDGLIRDVEGDGRINVYKEADIKRIDGFVGNFATTLAVKGVEKEPIAHGVVIVANGGNEVREEMYLLGKNDTVMTQRDLEAKISDGSAAGLKDVVMIQCAGSRDDDRPYCSRYCCGEALKNAIRLKKDDPARNVTIMYRDIRSYGFMEKYYTEARNLGVLFVRYDKDCKPVVAQENGVLTVRVPDPMLKSDLVFEPDALALSVGVSPQADNETYNQMLKVPLNAEGFFLEAHMKLRPVDFATEGVFLCGLAHAPKNMTETIVQAKAAAGRAATVLAKAHIEVEGKVSKVNEARCVACGVCEDVCPYNAVSVNAERNVAEVNAALCKGCGICSASCRSGAVDVQGFTDRQILAALESVV